MGSPPTRKIWGPVKPRHVHVSIKLDTSNGHSRATRRQAAVIGGLLSRKCRCQAFMPIEAEFEKLMTESRKINRKTKPNIKPQHIIKVSLTSFHILYLGWLIWYNVCKSCAFTVTCHSKQKSQQIFDLLVQSRPNDSGPE